MEIKRIVINKNRGWRGLSEVRCIADGEEVMKMVFSFSQPVWEDMLRGVIVLQNEKDFVLIRFDRTEKLPRPDQQRSVLIKGFVANVLEVIEIPKDNWMKRTSGTAYYSYIYNFTKNRNNHTTSDWNCVGIRVIPMI